MFGLGMSEIIIIAVLALILIGPEQLPEVARTLGRFINDLKRSADGLAEDIKNQAKVDLKLDLESLKEKPFKEHSSEIPKVAKIEDKDKKIENHNYSAEKNQSAANEPIIRPEDNIYPIDQKNQHSQEELVNTKSSKENKDS